MNQQVKHQVVEEVVDALRVVVAEQALLIPMAAVAEVVRGVEVSDADAGNDWLHGWLQWRELKIPLVAVESLLGDAKGSHTGTVNAVVVNTLGRAKGLDFYAFLLNDLPQPARISRSTDIADEKAGASSEFHLANVSINDEKLVIPDLEGVEKFLRAKL